MRQNIPLLTYKIRANVDTVFYKLNSRILETFIVPDKIAFTMKNLELIVFALS